MKACRFLTTVSTTALIATGVAAPAATTETYTPTVQAQGLSSDPHDVAGYINAGACFSARV